MKRYWGIVCCLITISILFASCKSNVQQNKKYYLPTPIFDDDTRTYKNEIIDLNNFEHSEQKGEKHAIQILIDETSSINENCSSEITRYRYDLPKFLISLLKDIERNNDFMIGVARFYSQKDFDSFLPMKKLSEYSSDNHWYYELSEFENNYSGENYYDSIRIAYDTLLNSTPDYKRNLVIITDGSISYEDEIDIQDQIRDVFHSYESVNTKIILLESNDNTQMEFWLNDIGGRSNIDVIFADDNIEHWLPLFVEDLFGEIDDLIVTENNISYGKWYLGNNVNNNVIIPGIAIQSQFKFIAFQEEYVPSIKNHDTGFQLNFNYSNVRNLYTYEILHIPSSSCEGRIFSLNNLNHGVGFFWINNDIPTYEINYSQLENLGSGDIYINSILFSGDNLLINNFTNCFTFIIHPDNWNDFDIKKINYSDSEIQQEVFDDSLITSWLIKKKDDNNQDAGLVFIGGIKTEPKRIPIELQNENIPKCINQEKELEVDYDLVNDEEIPRINAEIDFDKEVSIESIELVTQKSNEEVEEAEEEANKRRIGGKMRSCGFDEVSNDDLEENGKRYYRYYEVHQNNAQKMLHADYEVVDKKVVIRFHEYLFEICGYDGLVLKIINPLDSSIDTYRFEIIQKYE